MPKRYFSDVASEFQISCWEDDKEKLRTISHSSHKICKFRCKVCKHLFEISPNAITNAKQWCQYCNGKSICGSEECNTCYKKTFAFHNPERISEWSIENKIKANQVSYGSGKKYKFVCKVCTHVFEMSPTKIKNEKQWCQYCNGKSVCGSEECKTCCKKTLASLSNKDRLKQWSSENNFKPMEVFSNSATMVKIDCKFCNYTFKIKAHSISSGSWCPGCQTNKMMTELKKCFNELKIKFKLEEIVICNGRSLRWDMVIYNGDNVFYVESDGKQHFSIEKTMQLTRTKDKKKGQERFQDQRKRDLLKEKDIRDNDKLLFRVSYRQFKNIPELIREMIVKSTNKDKGVVYMDSIYWDESGQ